MRGTFSISIAHRFSHFLPLSLELQRFISTQFPWRTANSPVKFFIFINPKVCLKSGIWLLWCSVYRWGPGACGCAGHVLCLFCVCPLQWLLNLEASLSLSASEVSCINWKLGQFAAITSPISVSEPIWGKSSYVAGGKKSQGIHTITYH